MSYEAAGEYFARKRVEIATARAEQYWALPHPRADRRRPGRRFAAAGRALLHAAISSPLRIEGSVVSRSWMAHAGQRKAV